MYLKRPLYLVGAGKLRRAVHPRPPGTLYCGLELNVTSKPEVREASCRKAFASCMIFFRPKGSQGLGERKFLPGGLPSGI